MICESFVPETINKKYRIKQKIFKKGVYRPERKTIPNQPLFSPLLILYRPIIFNNSTPILIDLLQFSATKK